MLSLDAGHFGAWLTAFRASLRGTGGTDVPCGDCVGCCVSSFSILVRPEDTRALKAIPAELLTDATALGAGVKAMGYLPGGACPMLDEQRCGIYDSRPQTCRDFDCRVFAAAGIESGKAAIDARVRAWRFSYASAAEQAMHAAIRSAATFIREHRARFPELRLPKNPSGVAVLAVKTYEVFLHVDGRDAEALANAIVSAAQVFDLS